MGYVNQSAEKKNIDREIPTYAKVKYEYEATRPIGAPNSPTQSDMLLTLKVRTGF